jgi:hypothetical protein
MDPIGGRFLLVLPGASMVKYTTPLPCIGFNGIGSKLYTNFEFCEGKNHKHLKNTLIYKSQTIYVAKLKLKKSTHNIEDVASSCK